MERFLMNFGEASEVPAMDKAVAFTRFPIYFKPIVKGGWAKMLGSMWIDDSGKEDLSSFWLAYDAALYMIAGKTRLSGFAYKAMYEAELFIDGEKCGVYPFMDTTVERAVERTKKLGDRAFLVSRIDKKDRRVVLTHIETREVLLVCQSVPEVVG